MHMNGREQMYVNGQIQNAVSPASRAVSSLATLPVVVRRTSTGLILAARTPSWVSVLR
jgi:hypothetical protein